MCSPHQEDKSCPIPPTRVSTGISTFISSPSRGFRQVRVHLCHPRQVRVHLCHPPHEGFDRYEFIYVILLTRVSTGTSSFMPSSSRGFRQVRVHLCHPPHEGFDRYQFIYVILLTRVSTGTSSFTSSSSRRFRPVQIHLYRPHSRGFRQVQVHLCRPPHEGFEFDKYQYIYIFLLTRVLTGTSTFMSIN
jgi:hypothetical protein